VIVHESSQPENRTRLGASCFQAEYRIFDAGLLRVMDACVKKKRAILKAGKKTGEDF
jgi:hypothetical protein